MDTDFQKYLNKLLWNWCIHATRLDTSQKINVSISAEGEEEDDKPNSHSKELYCCTKEIFILKPSISTLNSVVEMRFA